MVLLHSQWDYETQEAEVDLDVISCEELPCLPHIISCRLYEIDVETSHRDETKPVSAATALASPWLLSCSYYGVHQWCCEKQNHQVFFFSVVASVKTENDEETDFGSVMWRGVWQHHAEMFCRFFLAVSRTRFFFHLKRSFTLSMNSPSFYCVRPLYVSTAGGKESQSPYARLDFWSQIR